jgi:SAM-dependent methyltransferase
MFTNSCKKKMDDKIELLSEELIDKRPHLALDVMAVSARLQEPLGWHYLLDLIWVLSELDLMPGATILEEGAGLGVLQFVLAERGYKVISADMAVREPRPAVRHMFNFRFMGVDGRIEHPYLAHHEWPQKPKPGWQSFLDIRVRDVLARPLGRLKKKAEPAVKPDPGPDTDRLPEIIFYRTDVRSMPEMAAGSVDAVVSLSALEHNEPHVVKQIQREAMRVVRPGGVILHTVSAVLDPGETFHEESHSWLLDKDGLKEAYLLEEPWSNYDRFDEIAAEIRNPRYLKRYLSHSYFQSGRNGMPWGIWKPEYLPVGIRKSVKTEMSIENNREMPVSNLANSKVMEKGV